MTNLESILKSKDIILQTEVCIVKAMVFPVVMSHKEGWALKNWCFWIEVLEKTFESPLDSKGIKPVNPKGNQPWNIHGKDWCWSSNTLATDEKSWLIGKDYDAGKDWRQNEKGVTEDEKVRWHHQLNGHEFEQTPGDSEGQGSLACSSSRGHKVSDMTVTEQKQHIKAHMT